MKIQSSLVVMLLLGMVLGVHAVYGQAEEEGPAEAPQILSSDLARKTLLTSDHLSVDFVIVDSDRVVKVTIDGEPQTFEPADTVLLHKDFVFTQAQSVVTVQATDEKGNTRTKTFLVTNPAGQAPPSELAWYVNLGVAYEVDTNPSNDLSTPVPLKGVDVTGVVPDSKQTDNRTTLRASVSAVKGAWSGFLGGQQQTYDKKENERFNTQTTFLGGSYRSGQGKASGFVLRYVFTDINLGTFDYAQMHTLSPGYESFSEDSEDRIRNAFFVDLISKDFAKQQQKDTSLWALRWDHSARDKADGDLFKSNLATGNGSEGYKDTEYTFYNLDLDWENRWKPGFRLDVGFGWQYRDFPNQAPLSKDTPLGDTRVDNLIRFSMGPGWEFGPNWRLLLGYRYLFNLSNKAPYVRQIYGVTVEGSL